MEAIIKQIKDDIEELKRALVERIMGDAGTGTVPPMIKEIYKDNALMRQQISEVVEEFPWSDAYAGIRRHVETGISLSIDNLICLDLIMGHRIMGDYVEIDNFLRKELKSKEFSTQWRSIVEAINALSKEKKKKLYKERFTGYHRVHE